MNVTITPTTFKAANNHHLKSLYESIEEIYITDNEISAILFQDGLYIPEDEDLPKFLSHIVENSPGMEFVEECLDNDPDSPSSFSAGVFMRELSRTEIVSLFGRLHIKLSLLVGV
jgi:hypothetical protein